MAASEGKDNGPSLVDISQEDLREAFAVLAGSDPDNCSYPQGYVKRQAVFACKTCTWEGMEPAGVCLACANNCHDGHDIFELYTKRNFRCDCGNGKFGSFKCNLYPKKDNQNIKNLYNHNFCGRYCTCDRPYPDSDDQVGDEMIQCVVCEDWYHAKHLGCAVVDSEELLEMVCESCMNQAAFLWTYAAYFSLMSPDKEDEEATTAEEETPTMLHPCRNDHDSTFLSNNGSKTESNKRTYDEMERCNPATCQAKSTPCKLKELEAKDQGTTLRARAGAVFWPYYWRSKLCNCTNCKRAYVQAGVQFLLDESDTLLAYENKGKTTALLGEDLLMTCLSSLDHVQQLEIIYQYNDSKAELQQFLQKFADQGKVVTAEAIRAFFQDLQQRRERRVSAGEYFCS